ncbi:MAG: hypothetical protein KC621_17265 [Myxococcales bacterium]|nr:hypothetical protein [Myxococcales bacterium]
MSVLPLVASVASCFGTAQPIEQTFPACVPDRPPQGPPAGDLERVFAQGPARCNDGSVPAMLVRPASDPAHADDWVLFLQGGNSCVDVDSCRERYCRTGHALMTSSRVPSRERSEGVLTSKPENPFAGWNAAFLHYCSSDQWLGDAEAPVSLDSMWSSYTVRFEGHRVLRQMLDTLDQGVTTDSGKRLPRLSKADHLLFSGSSAGGAGAAFHLDEVAKRYADTRVVGFVDGMMDPDLTAMDPKDRAAAEARQTKFWTRRYETWDAFQVAPCDRSGGSCDDPLFLWGTYIQTPATLRFDLRDPVLSELYTAEDAVPMAQVVRGYASVAKKMAAAKRPDRSVVVTDCALHYAAAEDAGTLATSVKGADGQPVRAVDAAYRLLTTGRATLAVDTPGGKGSRCPAKRRDE